MAIDLSKFRPNLAAQTDDYDWSKLKYPVYVSPKLDGIRCVCHPTLGPVTRTLKPIPNAYIRKVLSKPEFKWLDGEVLIGPINASDVFNRSQSGVMSYGGTPDFTYAVFDNFEAGHMCGFGIRIEDARRVVEYARGNENAVGFPVQLLEHRMVNNYEELVAAEIEALGQGYEGLMVRSPSGKYKFGRSTQREQGLLKMKRFIDDEAEIVGWEPLMRNQNDPMIDALGLQKRGYSKEGKVADDTRVGKFIVRGVPESRWTGVTFSIGSGLDDDSRVRFREAFRRYNIEPSPATYLAGIRDGLFNAPDNPLGKIVAYKYQAHGSLDAPRSPIWKGLRYD